MIIDNCKNGKVGTTIKQQIQSDARLSIISTTFSLYGYQALQEKLEQVSVLKLLMSDASEQTSHPIPDLTGDRFELRYKNLLIQSALARQCTNWLQQRAEIRQIRKDKSVNQNLFHLQQPDGDALAIQGNAGFTSTGLGYTESDQYFMNMKITDPKIAATMLEWFNAIWNDRHTSTDIKEQVLHQLNHLASDQPPELIYLLTLYHLFSGSLDELNEERIIKSKTGIHQTTVWNKLYKFQRDGVMGAIDKLERYNGCIIADSVGLGKTFEALAVIKYYELRNDRVLVLCPKKLRENWSIYTLNDRRNLLADDRFNYDILNHTDLTRTGGFSGDINLATLNWGNYDLIVIDESHNFRNTPDAKEGITRYGRLMNEVIRSGVKTKVLMLSATPVNNRMNDLKNQVAFITEGNDSAYKREGIASIEQTLRHAQTRFNSWLSEGSRTTQSLMRSLNFDYFKLLDMLTIARSRKHIEKYYDISEIGQFPQRLKPQNIKADIDTLGHYPPLKEINNTIRRLHLSAYSPIKYLRSDKRAEYSRKYDIQVKGGKSVFRQEDREQSLIHLMRVNLLKRMESSINSFALTLQKLLNVVEQLLQRLDSYQGKSDQLSIENIDLDDPELDDYLIGNKIKVLLQDMDPIRWRQDLEEDRNELRQLLAQAQAVKPNNDAKLKQLRHNISHKCANPINPNNRKIIIFTAFADTANYLYEQLADWAQKNHQLHSALITGSGANKTTLEQQSTRFDQLLTAFSPRSKERDQSDPDATTEIDLLIATDCISEGQNLQDCDTLINYDIHWNPVRIIQRFGRIDRLGSTNAKIQLINFWPNMELDEYINLEARVSGRMVLLDISATGEENVIAETEVSKMNDLDYRRKQLQQLQESVIDMEEMGGGVSITDLTLNDFRMDLSQALQQPQLSLAQQPTGLFAASIIDAALAAEGVESGVIFCLKNVGKPIHNEAGYALAPYYVIYVTDSGEVRHSTTQIKKSLDLLKKQGYGHIQADSRACQQFAQLTQNGEQMRHYQQLLQQAIENISGKSQQQSTESLFSRGGTQLSGDHYHGLDDFEVVSYLILLQP